MLGSVDGREGGDSDYRGARCGGSAGGAVVWARLLGAVRSPARPSARPGDGSETETYIFFMCALRSGVVIMIDSGRGVDQTCSVRVRGAAAGRASR